ncbi:DUF7255 family protein [Pleomorphovibrio marinus]|uniref:DUF7255 family protein n=1 Tax=Pleomorphovibrio marinus TaxID=2164132 RepID=UPI0018E522F0|nr:hypothetical protein [Pleomorphovibrio marinus]
MAGHRRKVTTLIQCLMESGEDLEEDFLLSLEKGLLDEKARNLLQEVFEILGGSGEGVYLQQLKFDFKMDRHLILYDDAEHFNRYRALTLRGELYQTFTYPWFHLYQRLCRQLEKSCLQVGLQERVWNGPPIARRCFGISEEPGDLSGNGAAGWKLNAYNDAQYDLMSRLHGYKIIRIPTHETIMLGGSLKKIDQLLLNPDEYTRAAISKWLVRKLE